MQPITIEAKFHLNSSSRVLQPLAIYGIVLSKCHFQIGDSSLISITRWHLYINCVVCSYSLPIHSQILEMCSVSTNGERASPAIA